ncbi:YIP1 family protein [Methanomicrobium antiquum]|uniref:YIP1 family protein n=1 Tax=Methanomicrobium antiquum TaxID=487686 RepID=A0AAF0FM13_9EURY|nr:Yip1 family protein [Methanomicrobium antiquum]MDD3977208.1 Yip1 family protein [Methanomicrobium sp.]WFN36345.1 YIP1 family protein [Methanomicrobium antiquum]
MISLKELLFSPKQFFEELNNKPENLKFPAIIIFVLAVISAISAAIVTSATSALFPEEMAFLAVVITVFTIVFTIVFTFILWVVAAGIFHIISSFLKAKGTFNRSLEITSYGMIPQIFGTLLSSVLVYMHFSSLNLYPVSSQAEIEALTTAISTGPLMTAGGIISLIFVLWSANIWIIGFMKCREMDVKSALIAVGIPVGIYILVSFVAMFLL